METIEKALLSKINARKFINTFYLPARTDCRFYLLKLRDITLQSSRWKGNDLFRTPRYILADSFRSCY